MNKIEAIDIIKNHINEVESEASLYNEGDFEFVNALKVAIGALEEDLNIGDCLEKEISQFAERNDFKLTEKQVTYIAEDLCCNESFIKHINAGIEKAVRKSVALNKEIRDFAGNKGIVLTDEKIEDIVGNLCCECNELYELKTEDIERGVNEWV